MFNLLYNDLLNINNKKSSLYFFTIILIVMILIITIFIKSYSVYYIKGIYDDHYIKFNLLKNNSDTIRKCKYVVINDIKYKFEIINYEDYLIENINYQEITIKINYEFEENEVIEMNFYYDYERIIMKIKDLIF